MQHKFIVTMIFSIVYLPVLTLADTAANNPPTQVLQRINLPKTGYQLGMGIGVMAPNTVKTSRIQSGPEIVYVMQGELILIRKGKPQKIIPSGESFQLEANEIHATKAGPKGAKFLASWVLDPSKPFVVPIIN